MVTCASWGLATLYRQFLRRVAARKGASPDRDRVSKTQRHATMLSQEGLQYFAVPWAAQVAEAVCPIVVTPSS